MAHISNIDKDMSLSEFHDIEVEWVNGPSWKSIVRTLYQAYRTCYGGDKDKKPTYEEMEDFVVKHRNHQSVFEHIVLTFRVKNISRVLTHQLVRHRLASFSQQSQRYTKKKEFKLVVPPSVFTALVEDGKEHVVLTNYEIALGNMIQYLKDKGVTDEDIRYFFPNAFDTEIVVSANLREWMHIFNERLCSRASLEIRIMMEKIAKLIEKQYGDRLIPTEPKCLSLRYCPEERSCKRMPQQPPREDIIIHPKPMLTPPVQDD